MKKLIAAILTLIIILSASVNVLADGTTTLTTTVPAATYTLNIPADQEIAYAANSTNIGNVTVTDSTGFGRGKNLQVTITYNAFSCDSVNTTIPYIIKPYHQSDKTNGGIVGALNSGDTFTFAGQSNGTVTENAKFIFNDEAYEMDYLRVDITSENWGKALAGEYSTIITFTSEVVSSEG